MNDKINEETRKLVLFGFEFAAIIMLATGMGLVFGNVGAAAIVAGLWLMSVVVLASYRRDR